MVDASRVVAVGILVVLSSSCSQEARSPVAPAGSTLDSFAGRVVRYQDGAPVASAVVSFGTASATTVADGTFRLSGVPSGPVLLSGRASGYLERAKWVTLSPAVAVEIDMIRDAAPFSLGFYRELARAGTDSPDNLADLRPWTVDPSFYFRTVVHETGDPVPPAIVEEVARVVTAAVPELTGGRFRAAAVEFGTEERPTVVGSGWVNVGFWLDLGVGIGGLSGVGGNHGNIRLKYVADEIPGLLNCLHRVVRYADHEIVHTMGFWHTSSTFADFQSGEGCPGTGRPARVAYHASVVYARPRGNLDEDRDPTVPRLNLLASPSFAQPHPLIACDLDAAVREWP